MPNNYFQFKQFTVYQQHCAMKVCTDACLFGAWMADYLQPTPTRTVLDIGTGTGLLSLMLAQKNTAIIDAVEIDAAAAAEATTNFLQSPWNDRAQVTHCDIRLLETEKKYDCIISNPPFFENDLQSPLQNKNAAKHHSTLTLQVLLQQVKKLLLPEGYFAVLLPAHRVDYFIEECLQHHLYCHEKVLVKQTPGHGHFRGMLIFSAKKGDLSTGEILIKNATGDYSAAFTSLLQDYYLYL